MSSSTTPSLDPWLEAGKREDDQGFVDKIIKVSPDRHIAFKRESRFEAPQKRPQPVDSSAAVLPSTKRGRIMKGLLWIVALVLFAVVATQQTKALEVIVGEAKIKIAGPKGYCALDKKHPADSQTITTMQQSIQGRNEEVAVFARCDRLKAWRDGKADNLGNTADYQVSLRMKGQNVSAQQAIPGVCAEFRKKGVALVKGAENEIDERYDSVKELAGKLKINSQEMYGILHEDKSGCYAGIIQKLNINDKAETVFIVQAITVVKGKMLFFYHGSDFDGPSAIQQLLDTSRSTIAATLAQN
jgi:hypothetical protein